ncbi:hypothetical protein PAMA_013762 [Pampus argenteus]
MCSDVIMWTIRRIIYKTTKKITLNILFTDSHFVSPIQSDNTNQDSAANPMVNLNETQRDVYSSLLHGDACLYESITGSDDNENGTVYILTCSCQKCNIYII